MSKTRLNQFLRVRLINHAKGLISCPEEQAVYAAARAALCEESDRLAAGRFPNAEMRILAKFDMVTTRDSLDIKAEGDTGHRCVHVPLSKSRHLPSNGYHGSCHFAVILPTDAPVWALDRAYREAENVHQNAIERKLNDYRTLIDDSRNFEDVTEVWPEAEGVRAASGIRAPTAIMRLNPDVIARIKADTAARASA